MEHRPAQLRQQKNSLLPLGTKISRHGESFSGGNLLGDGDDDVPTFDANL
jgi:hypothetical protein